MIIYLEMSEIGCQFYRVDSRISPTNYHLQKIIFVTCYLFYLFSIEYMRNFENEKKLLNSREKMCR